MSSHHCTTCSGARYLCKTCRRSHRSFIFGTKCRGRKTIPCPGALIVDTETVQKIVDGVMTTPPLQRQVPCFQSFVECDVCRVQELGEIYRSDRTGLDTRGWALVTRAAGSAHLYLCPACAKRHEEIRSMTMEYLMTERGQMNAGVWTTSK